MHDGDDFEGPTQSAMALAIAYRKQLAGRPPRPTASAAELRERFDVGIPEQGRQGSEVIEALAAAAADGLVANTSPQFFAWVMGASHPVGVAAEWLTSTWGQNACIYDTAPAAAVAEDVSAGWLLDLLDLPRGSSVGFTTGASMASTICLAAARSWVLHRAGYDLEQRGVFAAPAVKVFLGEEAHSTIISGLRFLGFGEDDLVRIAVDGQGRMHSDALEITLAQHPGPKIVICQAGHINSGDFDPLPEITRLCSKYGAWCHVDGAFGLWARAVPQLHQLAAGAEMADSWSVDGHKWLQVPYDSGFAIVRHPEAHRRAMEVSASYLSEAPGDARSPSLYCSELSRRARGFAVWAVIQALGRSGISEMVSRHCHCAQALQQQLAAEPGIAVLNEVVLNQLAITFGQGLPGEEQDALTDTVLATLERENEFHLEGARWRGRNIMRVSIISQRTDETHTRRLGQAIIHAWHTVANSHKSR